MKPSIARKLLHLVARVVPADRRQEWLEEWQSELDVLTEARTTTSPDLPTIFSFVLGAIPHALWLRTEGWSLDRVTQDVRFACRVLKRSPSFTVVAAVTLALGIGANASIFSLVNGLVLRAPAEVQQPDRLVQIARSYDPAPRWDNWSWPALQTIKATSRGFSGIAGYQGRMLAIGEGAETEQVVGELVTGDYFNVVGVRPFIGRLLQPSDDLEVGGHPVAVLSHALWSRRFGEDPSIVGTTVAIGSEPYVVVGVTPPGFAGVESVGSPPAVWIPTMMHPSDDARERFEQWGSSWIQLIGRLQDGASYDDAVSSLEIVTSRLREASPVNEGIRVLATPGVGLDPEERAEASQISVILLLIAGLVLLITCTNVASLMLARAADRRSEMGMRLALGAGRGRLTRQLLTESVILAGFATVLALPIVRVAGDLLPLVFPYTLAVSVHADARVYLVLLGSGAVASLLFGTAPAWILSRRDVVEAIREGSTTRGPGRTRLRDSIVASQIALSFALVVGATLLGRSVMNAQRADPGFAPRGVVATGIDLHSTGRYDESSGRRYWESLLRHASTAPGVDAVTLSNQVPLVGGHSRAGVSPAGRPHVLFEAEYNIVGPNYFETLGVRLRQGRSLRGFGDEAERVVVVNEALASLFWPGLDPIGQELQGQETWRVVGVVGDVQMRSLRSPPSPAVYYPLDQVYSPRMYLQVRGQDDQPISDERLRSILAQEDGDLPASRIVHLDESLTESMGETRTIGFLLATFAGLALTLAMVGLYGLVSYSASQRVREIGIRIALGAAPRSLARLMLARGVTIAAVGIVVGIGVSFGLSTVLRGLLFGIGHSDAAAYASSSLLMLTVATIAAWLPARRASRADATTSLRDAS